MRRLRISVVIIVFALSTWYAPAPAGSSTTTAAREGPIAHVAPWIQRVFTCIIWRESRSTWAHPNLKDVSRWGSSGIFQMEPVLWNRWAPVIGISVPIWRASVLQQERVAVEVYRHDGFAPWRDGCA